MARFETRRRSADYTVPAGTGPPKNPNFTATNAQTSPAAPKYLVVQRLYFTQVAMC
jgi:hypothetical protein